MSLEELLFSSYRTKFQVSSQASNIDDVLKYHNDLLDNCLKDCMLTNTELIKTVSKLMVVCVTFCNCIQVRDFTIFAHCHAVV